jgi:hypothetical protein
MTSVSNLPTAGFPGKYRKLRKNSFDFGAGKLNVEYIFVNFCRHV